MASVAMHSISRLFDLSDRRWRFHLAAVLVVAPTAIFAVLLHGGSGDVWDLAVGQFRVGPTIERADVSLRPPADEPTLRVEVDLTSKTPVERVAPEYLSFAIDATQLVGGRWWRPEADEREMGGGVGRTPMFDFERPLLDVLIAPFAPAYVRIGGSEADRVWYAVDEASRPEAPRPGFGSVLTHAQWRSLERFAARNGLSIAFTLNAGPSVRDEDGAWTVENAERLLAAAAREGTAIDVWELGNELNAFWVVHGPGTGVSAEQYAKDFAVFDALVAEQLPNARVGAQGPAIWPVIGEPARLFFGSIEEALSLCGERTDTVSFHYYPQQSRRSPMASRRAHPTRLLVPENLDEAGHWARWACDLRDRYAPGRPVWLGETGNAQIGGEPGVSDVYLSTLWWLDQLGLLAREGVDVMVRQSLEGLHYGLLEQETLAPRPDYWASLVWRRTMGEAVYAVDVERGANSPIRAYAHGARSGQGVTLLLVNLDPLRSAEVVLGPALGGPAALYELRSPDVFGQVVLLNGAPLAVTRDGELPGLAPRIRASAGALIVPPLSATFATLPEALVESAQ